LFGEKIKSREDEIEIEKHNAAKLRERKERNKGRGLLRVVLGSVGAAAVKMTESKSAINAEKCMLDGWTSCLLDVVVG
jgi:hypothetical protein